MPSWIERKRQVWIPDDITGEKGEVAMGIFIYNITHLFPKKEPGEFDEYELKINRERICYFKHRREDGLAECLRRAAEAVEKSNEKYTTMK